MLTRPTIGFRQRLKLSRYFIFADISNTILVFLNAYKTELQLSGSKLHCPWKTSFEELCLQYSQSPPIDFQEKQVPGRAHLDTPRCCWSDHHRDQWVDQAHFSSLIQPLYCFLDLFSSLFMCFMDLSWIFSWQSVPSTHQLWLDKDVLASCTYRSRYIAPLRIFSLNSLQLYQLYLDDPKLFEQVLNQPSCQ